MVTTVFRFAGARGGNNSSIESASTTAQGGAVYIQQFLLEDVVVITLTGRLDQKAVPKVQDALLKRLAQEPRGIIVDLVAVEAIDPVCAAVFSATTRPASRWPGTTVVLCRAWSAVAKVLNAVDVPRFLPLCDTLEQALTMARGVRPTWLRESFRLWPCADTAEQARSLVATVCARWRLPDLVTERARTVAAALAEEAAGDPDTKITLRLGLRLDRLSVSVQHNRSTAPPSMPAGQDRSPEVLRLLRRHASSAGTRPHPEGGTISWWVSPVGPQQSIGGGHHSIQSDMTSDESHR
jgi:anti-anti-sigma factor